MRKNSHYIKFDWLDVFPEPMKLGVASLFRRHKKGLFTTAINEILILTTLQKKNVFEVPHLVSKALSSVQHHTREEGLAGIRKGHADVVHPAIAPKFEII